MINLIPTKLILAALVVVAGGGYFLFKNHQIEQLQEELDKRSAEIEKTLTELATARALLEEQRKTLANNTALLAKLDETEALIRADINEKIKIVTDERLDNLANKKPGLIEIRANKATTQVFEEIEGGTHTFYETYNK